jgi:two-component system, chemotaxis family, chemotaxis protein CheY
MKVLIVDDSRATRCFLKKMLNGLAESVIEAANGQEALDTLLAQGATDLALVDWNMPVMNGLELIKKIRAKSEFDQMQILMVTTETEMTQVIKAIEAGANEYLMKPCTPAMMQEKLAIMGFEVPQS